jgi:hypothetical protein
MVVGFDPRFFTPAVSREFATREEAMKTALAHSRATGLPVITLHALSAGCGPGEAA